MSFNARRLRPLGYTSNAVSSSAASQATSLALPTGVVRSQIDLVLFICESSDVRWRDDGTAPGASSVSGALFKTDGSLLYDGDPDKVKFVLNANSANPSTIHAYFYAG